MVVSTYGTMASFKAQKNITLTTRISWMPWRITSLLFNENREEWNCKKSALKTGKRNHPFLVTSENVS